MTAPTLNRTSNQTPGLSIWRSLTQPASTLKEENKSKAQILASAMLVFLPLGVFALIVEPLSALLNNRPIPVPSTINVIAVLAILLSYLLSRSPYYRVSAWLAILIPLAAIVAPSLSTGDPTTASSLFFLALSVILAGLLLSSNETFLIGGFITALVLIMPSAGTASANSSQSVNISASLFILMTTFLTGIVGRDREQSVALLRKSQVELKQSLTATEEARNRAEHSDKVKSAFLASMSHELRTPLNAVINFTRFVAKGDLGPVNAEQSDLLGQVIESAMHLLNLINDVLDMSKIEAGSLSLFIEDNIDLQAILTQAVTVAQSLLADKSVELHTDIGADLPVIRADRQRVYQGMLNILSNACKFTKQGSIWLRAKQTGDDVLISVQDTGPGIAPEDQPLVFEAFRQTDAGLRQSGGTGLGMPISKTLIEAHGGRLWIESQAGEGATFFVSLPIKSQQLVPMVSITGRAKS